MTTEATNPAGDKPGGAPPAGGNDGQPLAGFRGSSTGAPLGRPAAADPAETQEERPRRPVQAAALGGEENLRTRLQRTADAERRRLLAELQIEDPVAFKKAREAELAELARLKKAEEDAKRAQMSEVERFKADLEAARAELAERDKKIESLEETIYAGQGDATARAAAAPFIDPDFVDYALVELKKHLRGKTDAEIAEFDDGDMRRFFRRLASDRPKLAKPAEPQAPTNPPRSVAAVAPRRPAQQPAAKRTAAPPSALRRLAGAPAARQAPPLAKADAKSGELNGKTVRPGQANSMTKAELASYLAQTGRKMY